MRTLPKLAAAIGVLALAMIITIFLSAAAHANCTTQVIGNTAFTNCTNGYSSTTQRIGNTLFHNQTGQPRVYQPYQAPQVLQPHTFQQPSGNAFAPRYQMPVPQAQTGTLQFHRY